MVNSEDYICPECGEEPRYCSCEVLNMAEKVLNETNKEDVAEEEALQKIRDSFLFR